MAVSGGHTPLADATAPWPDGRVSLGIASMRSRWDERVAPDGHPDRNLTDLGREPAGACPAASRADLCHAGRSDRSGSRGPELTPATLREIAGSPPVLDLVHLGLGVDGHTASLVPGDPGLDVTEADVATDRGPTREDAG